MLLTSPRRFTLTLALAHCGGRGSVLTPITHSLLPHAHRMPSRSPQLRQTFQEHHPIFAIRRGH